MASSNGGRGSQRGRGRGGKLYSPDSGKFIDAEGFTMVKSKRGGSIGTSSSHSVNQSKATMADIVARDEMTDYIPKELSPHICYIEQEDYNLLEDPLMIRKEYFSPFQAPTLYGKPRGYFETILQLSDCMTITHTRENPKDNTSAIVYSKVIIKKLVKPGSWGFDLTTGKEEVSTFLRKSSLNPFDLLKDQIKSENPNISEYELMKKCMFFFKDQFSSNFCKDDSSMGSGSNKEDTEECILAGESQDPEDDLDENIDDQEYHELASFWHSLREDKRIRPKSKP
ncbi:hypothetical protein Acr_00g0065090 [Actinidia rufa]|uniref:Uncharacterized protein n=1 Tax=Actinidia rufa TaxID=165716 RepID=A0A7J0DPQ6_9ERIC|nr:hypothetical protein Acr_00g0065090 [Actinidia rufa]